MADELDKLLNFLLHARQSPDRGDAVFRCGFNGALDVIAARIREMKAERNAGVPASSEPKRHSLCGKCMTPHICAEDGPGCKPASGAAMPEVPVTLEQVEQLAKTMWKGEPVPGRVLRFGAAVLGLADAARNAGVPASDEPNGKRSTSAATASGHELPNGTAAAAASLSVANGGDARVASADCPSCARSHPHENMSEECERLTVIARQENAATRGVDLPGGRDA